MLSSPCVLRGVHIVVAHPVAPSPAPPRRLPRMCGTLDRALAPSRHDPRAVRPVGRVGHRQRANVPFPSRPLTVWQCGSAAVGAVGAVGRCPSSHEVLHAASTRPRVLHTANTHAYAARGHAMLQPQTFALAKQPAQVLRPAAGSKFALKAKFVQVYEAFFTVRRPRGPPPHGVHALPSRLSAHAVARPRARRWTRTGRRPVVGQAGVLGRAVLAARQRRVSVALHRPHDRGAALCPQGTPCGPALPKRSR